VTSVTGLRTVDDNFERGLSLPATVCQKKNKKKKQKEKKK
jgi:hypothetical protein